MVKVVSVCLAVLLILFAIPMLLAAAVPIYQAIPAAPPGDSPPQFLGLPAISAPLNKEPRPPVRPVRSISYAEYAVLPETGREVIEAMMAGAGSREPDRTGSEPEPHELPVVVRAWT
jgi:hypothetical protein